MEAAAAPSTGEKGAALFPLSSAGGQQQLIDRLCKDNKKLQKKVTRLHEELQQALSLMKPTRGNKVASETKLLKKIFNEDQIQVLQRDKRNGHEWSEETMQTSIRLRKVCGIKGYGELVRLKYPLPSNRTVRRYLEKKRKTEEGTNGNGPTVSEDSGGDATEAAKTPNLTTLGISRPPPKTSKDEGLPEPRKDFIPPPKVDPQPGGVYLYKVGGGYSFGPLPNDPSMPSCPTIRQRQKRASYARRPKPALGEAPSIPPPKKSRQKGGFEGDQQLATNQDQSKGGYLPEVSAPAPTPTQFQTVYQLQAQAAYYAGREHFSQNYYSM